MTTLFLFVALFVFLIIGMPIAISLGLSSLLTILLFANDSMASLALKFFQTAELYTLLAIPFFVLAGAFMTTGGVARRMIAFANACVGHMYGGLAIASVVACMLFAAVSGSSPATVVAVGSIVIAGMVRAGYTQTFAAGVVCNAGTLGILIPPSLVMVVYAAATESSVGRLFMAGVIPGALLGLMLATAIYISARVNRIPRQPRAPLAEVIRTGRNALWGLLLIVIIMGGIYGGIFTPTEASAIGVAYAFVVGMFIETSASIIVLAPILAPVAIAFGIDPVHFGIIMVVNLAMGMFTPPFGVNLFAASAVARVPLNRMVPYLLPFIGVVMLCQAVITYWSPLALTLRDLVYR